MTLGSPPPLGPSSPKGQASLKELEKIGVVSWQHYFSKKDRGVYSTNTVGMHFVCLKEVIKLFYAVIKQVAEEQSRTWRATFF